jgi:DnaJ-class molecular chaperone
LFEATLKGLKTASIEPPKDLQVEVKCSLAELYNGCTKPVTYSRQVRLSQVMLADKITQTQQNFTKELEVRPGYSSQTKVIFPGEGNESSGFPNCTVYSADLIFRIAEESSPSFSRNKRDLTYTYQMPLLDALLAKPISIQTLDGRVLTLSFDTNVTPHTVKVIENEGMPFIKGNEYATDLKKYGRSHKALEKGNLYVKFSIVFPKYLPDAYKCSLRDILDKPQE